MDRLNWAVKIECPGGKFEEPNIMTMAAFRHYVRADDFIKAIVPEEDRHKCKIVYNGESIDEEKI